MGVWGYGVGWEDMVQLHWDVCGGGGYGVRWGVWGRMGVWGDMKGVWGQKRGYMAVYWGYMNGSAMAVPGAAARGQH